MSGLSLQYSIRTPSHTCTLVPNVLQLKHKNQTWEIMIDCKILGTWFVSWQIPHVGNHSSRAPFITLFLRVWLNWLESILVSSVLALRTRGFVFRGTKGFATVSFSPIHQRFQYIHFPSTWCSAAPQSSEICGCSPSPTFSSKSWLEKEKQKIIIWVLFDFRLWNL